MNKIKKSKHQKCECGKIVSIGSVFCPTCKTEIEKRNTKTLGRENALFSKKY